MAHRAGGGPRETLGTEIEEDHSMRPGTLMALAVAVLPLPRAAATAQTASPIPLVRGLTLVSVLRVPEGDRENTVVVSDVTPDGVTYSWRYRERRSAGGPVEEGSSERFVSASDLASARRLNSAFRGAGRDETPGYTAMSLSRAIYRDIRLKGKADLTTMSSDPSGGSLGMVSIVPYQGTLALVSRQTEPMPMLVNGRRTTLATLHVRGRFTYRDHSSDLDYWVLADSTHPLILKGVAGPKLFEIVRIDLAMQPAVIEHDLEQGCRVELPGIYFGFASAELQPASERSLDLVATLLTRHPDWSLAIEGHTDDIGEAAANQKLSVQRAEAVRAALADRVRDASRRLSAVGFGATRPRETNTTLEGRARNRRVELVRDCGRRTP